MFPLTFLSNAFIPTTTLPGALQPVANWNPISAVVLELRDLWGNAPAAASRGTGWATRHPAPLALLWIVGILVVFVPLAVRAYRRAAAR
jgi:ABC-2 type transport system permease protein